MAQPRILTFNFHEPYLCLMAKTGLEFDVGLIDDGPLARPWHNFFRELPGNLKPQQEDTWRNRMRAGHYDVIITQNEMNALDVYHAPAAKLLICHNRRTFLNQSATVDQGDAVETFSYLIKRLQSAFSFIFISESKRDDYGVPGRVILPGIDLDDFSGYTGDRRNIIRVGNTMRERNLMFDVDLQEAACAGLPNQVIGVNPAIPESRPAASFDELLGHYRHDRVMLHVSREEYEDGYNLAMLEAMGTGMPVVALANNTSPITNGEDGFTGTDAEMLRDCLTALLDDVDLARRIGERGRETIREKFPIAAFAENWRDAIMEAAESNANYASGVPAAAPPKVLAHFITYPLTTGRYIEDALRSRVDTLTVGMRMPEEVLRNWGFADPIPPYGRQDVDVPFDAPYDVLRAALPDDYQPDLYLYIDSGHDTIEPGIELMDAPKVAYLIDTHITPKERLAMARHFDRVYLAQKAQVEEFRAAGIREVSWLPLACSPGLHRYAESDRPLDVAYVGGFNAQEIPRRRELLTAVGERFPNCYIGRAWPDDMAQIYANSKIVVNAACNNDLNMRVFEALASGALLITDEVTGLEDLFEDGKHLVVYRKDEDLLDLIAHYLADDEARERIAKAGRAEVVANHTYGHRVDTILRDCGLQSAAQIAGRSPTNKTNEYYEHPRRELMPFIPLFTRRVLDVGCGAGTLASTLKSERKLLEASGLEVIESAWKRASKVLDTAVLGSIEDMELPFEPKHFDCVICADVLEHLEDPSAALVKLAAVLADDGHIVISIPNVQYHEVIAMLSTGGWTYQDAGILDETHFRFFTKSTVDQMIRDAGLETLTIQPLSLFDKSKLPLRADGSLQIGAVHIQNVTDEEHEAFRVYQYLAIAGKPGVDRLARARAALAAKEYEAALAFAEEALGVNESDRKRIIARALSASGKVAEAYDIYTQLMADSPDPAIVGEYGTLLVAMNRSAEAIPYLEDAVAADPEADRTQAALGLARFAGGENEAAWDHLYRALDANYDHAGLLVHFAALADALGRWADAEPLLRRFAEFYPANADTACFWAEALIALGRGAEAHSALEMTLLLTPDHARAQELRAQTGMS